MMYTRLLPAVALPATWPQVTDRQTQAVGSVVHPG